MQPEPSTSDANVPPLERSHWVAFAGIILMLSGLFDIINGFVAILNHGYYETTANHGNRLLIFNYTAWGWIWVVTGIAQILASLGVFLGVRGARITGIVLASLCLVGQLMFLSTLPFWSLATMGMSVLVIYGLVIEPRHVQGMRV
ncbi:hypothetical protein GCM10010193_24980 [Kitasatospora atroaurantiaca]|uniref:DUF7144 domain-containing protein n=1 Tax=Kitasatospora atroaurantiaca TaxID=285545 RepID=A0A561F0P5_9ACTN|nr:hypothetical protein [Kitasatospora atroaurantiaca]TWE21431.1 hypothetical protein FB465_6614 [Kitasatospora atroaurantiaca]